jgi:transposase
MPASKPPYPAEFREQMVELARAGRGLKELSREFGVSANAIRNWVQRSRAEPVRSTPLRSDAVPLSATERQELVELRRRLKQVQMERDILAKATAWFAGKREVTLDAARVEVAVQAHHQQGHIDIAHQHLPAGRGRALERGEGRKVGQQRQAIIVRRQRQHPIADGDALGPAAGHRCLRLTRAVSEQPVTALLFDHAPGRAAGLGRS